MTDAGMPMPALVFWMPMPTYDTREERLRKEFHLTEPARNSVKEKEKLVQLVEDMVMGIREVYKSSMVVLKCKKIQKCENFDLVTKISRYFAKFRAIS
jgi:hypothetical protein